MLVLNTTKIPTELLVELVRQAEEYISLPSTRAVIEFVSSSYRIGGYMQTTSVFSGQFDAVGKFRKFDKVKEQVETQKQDWVRWGDGETNYGKHTFHIDGGFCRLRVPKKFWRRNKILAQFWGVLLHELQHLKDRQEGIPSGWQIARDNGVRRLPYRLRPEEIRANETSAKGLQELKPHTVQVLDAIEAFMRTNKRAKYCWTKDDEWVGV